MRDALAGARPPDRGVARTSGAPVEAPRWSALDDVTQQEASPLEAARNPRGATSQDTNNPTVLAQKKTPPVRGPRVHSAYGQMSAQSPTSPAVSSLASGGAHSNPNARHLSSSSATIWRRQMEWLSNNWIWIALAAAMVAMHTFGHGHGGHRHGRRASRGADTGPPSDTARERGGAPADEAGARAPAAATTAAATEGEHRHGDRRHGC